MKRHRILKISLISFLSLIILLISSFFIYTSIYYRPDNKALDALISDTIMIEEHNDFYSFIPENAKAGIVFYPGAKVDERAYAPLMLELANHSFACFLIKMPFHLAFFGQNRANNVLLKYTNITNWYIMGHSLGGVVASIYAKKNDQISGVVLLASYSNVDLSNTDLKIISIYGSNDGVLSLSSYEANKKNLPSDFCEFIIDGGNHSGFGFYGHQKNDGFLKLEEGRQIIYTASLIDDYFFGEED